jgi:hypothetical protein
MIVTDRFVFLHLHKSGGSFVNDFLMRFLPDARAIGYHLPRKLLPPHLNHLPALGFVRNPWSYYVSWYFFQKRRPEPNGLFRIVSDDGQLDFEHTVGNLLELGRSGRRLDAVTAALPRRYTNTGLNLPGFALEGIRGSGRGFYSFLYRYLYDAPGVMHVRRMERLREELIPMLVAVGQPVSSAMSIHVQEAPARNETQHGDYSQYYGNALRDLVAEGDAEVIAGHNYRFGD